MSKKSKNKDQPEPRICKFALCGFQVERVRLQRRQIENGLRRLFVLGRRRASGKDLVIEWITKHFSPRDTPSVSSHWP